MSEVTKSSLLESISRMSDEATAKASEISRLTAELERVKADLAAAHGELERLKVAPVPTPPRRDPEDFIEHRNGPEGGGC